jgi:hypothetical protein
MRYIEFYFIFKCLFLLPSCHFAVDVKVAIKKGSTDKILILKHKKWSGRKNLKHSLERYSLVKNGSKKFSISIAVDKRPDNFCNLL